jgi:hypothetical protein
MNLTRGVPTAAGWVLGGLFGAAAIVRGGRPLHPKGTVCTAVLRRTGMADGWGAGWLEEPGEDHGTARLSRAIGLPGALPDILGLALAFRGPNGRRHDLLLATTGVGSLTRFLLLPRRDTVRSTYTSLFPYAAPRGPVVLAAEPVATARPLPEGRAFRMLAARPAGRWREFGRLELTDTAAADLPIRFDPALHPLPDLRLYGPLSRLREPAYAAARRLGPTRAAPVEASR